MTENKSRTVKECVKEIIGHMKSDIECDTVQIDNFVFSEKGIEILPKNTKSDARHAGLRYNQGKLRYDLICPEQLKGLASVYTYGATKYKPHNWSKGQAYSTILASLKRHIAAFEAGEDYDAESKAEHIEKLEIDWFCDDSFSTFSELNKRGICCFLIDAKHNQRYDVGAKRIKSLVELKERW